MPQVDKRCKSVFSWCGVSSSGEIRILLEVFTEDGYQIVAMILSLWSSRRSGGFSVRRQGTLTGSNTSIFHPSTWKGIFHKEGRIAVPPMAGIQPGQHLLTVRGSKRVYCTFTHGKQIYEEILLHPETETFAIP